jgi:adenylate kinase
MWVALTGTPGTGKTTVAGLLREKGFSVVDVNALAFREGFVDGVDEKRNCTLINIQKINKFITKTYHRRDLVFFEGHVTHLLSSMQRVIVLRCHPQELQKHLQMKHWNAEKIRENLEAEMLDVILCETMELHDRSQVFEIDTTLKTPEEVTGSILEILAKGFRPIKQYRIGRIDWSEEILKTEPSQETHHGS